MMALAGGNIGFIGTGLMGCPMALNLVAAGVRLTVHNRTRDKTASLAEAGAIVAANPAEIAEALAGCIIIICVNDTRALEAVVGGDDGLLAALKPGTLVIDMGTTTVDATRAIADLVTAAGGAFIDAPVSGGVVGAEAGSLSIMAGGDDAALVRAAPVFEVLGSTFTYIGPVGSGQVAKAVNQVIVGMTLDAVAEGLMLAKSAGADPAKVREALLGGFAQSRILDVHGQRMIARAFEPGGRAEIQLKDLDQARELAAAAGVNLPGFERAHALWSEMVGRGWGGLDQSGFIRLIEAINQGDDHAGS